VLEARRDEGDVSTDDSVEGNPAYVPETSESESESEMEDEAELVQTLPISETAKQRKLLLAKLARRKKAAEKGKTRKFSQGELKDVNIPKYKPDGTPFSQDPAAVYTRKRRAALLEKGEDPRATPSKRRGKILRDPQTPRQKQWPFISGGIDVFRNVSAAQQAQGKFNQQCHEKPDLLRTLEEDFAAELLPGAGALITGIKKYLAKAAARHMIMETFDENSITQVNE